MHSTSVQPFPSSPSCWHQCSLNHVVTQFKNVRTFLMTSSYKYSAGIKRGQESCFLIQNTEKITVVSCMHSLILLTIPTPSNKSKRNRCECRSGQHIDGISFIIQRASNRPQSHSALQDLLPLDMEVL